MVNSPLACQPTLTYSGRVIASDASVVPTPTVQISDRLRGFRVPHRVCHQHATARVATVRTASLAASLIVLLVFAGCAGQSPPQVVVSYASTPAPPLLAPAVATPTAGRLRPTRIPTDLPPIRPTRPGPTVLPTTLDTPATIATPFLVEPTPLATAAQTGAPPDAASDDTPPSVSPSPAAEIANPSPTVDVVTRASTATGVSPSATSTSSSLAGPTGIPGQVPESQGQFVTSSSRSSRYYYARADTGWRRIHPDHRAWFLTAEALLRAFPGRVLHGSATPTPGVRATATATG